MASQALFKLPNGNTCYHISGSSPLAPDEGGALTFAPGFTGVITFPESIIDDEYRYVAFSARLSATATYGAGTTSRVWPSRWVYGIFTDLRISGRSYGAVDFQSAGPVPDYRNVYEFRSSDPTYDPSAGITLQWGQDSAIAVSAVAPDVGSAFASLDNFFYFMRDI